jgi:hypothetical protein
MSAKKGITGTACLKPHNEGMNEVEKRLQMQITDSE